MAPRAILYVSDASGKPTSVIVPIKLWREIEAERETAYLLKSRATRKRLLDARQRDTGVPLGEARERLGI